MTYAGRPVLPSVTVVVPAYNCADVIGAQLEALSGQSYPGRFDVVVSDNRSVDSLAEVVDSFRGRVDVRRVEASGRQGVSHARNIGCRATDSDVIAICDADDVVDPGWLEAMVKALDRADIVGGRLELAVLNPSRTRRWRSATDDALPRPMSFLPYPRGANVGFHRGVFEALDGWDEDLVAGGDDIDFGWRAQLTGFRLGFASDAVVHYRLRTSLRATMRQVANYASSNALLVRRFRAAGLVSRAPGRLPRDLAWLLTRSPYLLLPGSWRRGRWLVQAAGLWGRFRGSVRHHVWAL